MNSYILHIDGDAFFASVEISRRPDLQGSAVVVGEERGIACALTYEAKKLGVYRGMPIFQIRQQFPKVIVLSSHFELYEKYNANLVKILNEYLPVVEPYSIDECFTLLPQMEKEEISEFVKMLKNKVQTSLGITFSFGVSTTKTLAKIASKKEKPNGCTLLIEENEITEALKETQVGAVWGIGRQISASLLSKNIKTAFEFINTPREVIKELFSEPVVETWEELRGIKISEVSAEQTDQKSIQSTRAFIKASPACHRLQAQPMADRSLVEQEIFSELSRNIEVGCENLRSANLFTNSVSAFLKHADGLRGRESVSTILPMYTQDPKVILKFLRPLISSIYEKNIRYKATGIALLNLKRQNYITDDLFGSQSTHLSKNKHLEVIDALNRKFGDFSIMNATSLSAVSKRREEFLKREKKDSYEYNLPLPYMGEAF
ncbi:MAG: hypothetical protein WCV55_02280 [Candidatus Paceibacterota bacterium]